MPRKHVSGVPTLTAYRPSYSPNLSSLSQPSQSMSSSSSSALPVPAKSTQVQELCVTPRQTRTRGSAGSTPLRLLWDRRPRVVAVLPVSPDLSDRETEDCLTKEAVLPSRGQLILGDNHGGCLQRSNDVGKAISGIVSDIPPSSGIPTTRMACSVIPTKWACLKNGGTMEQCDDANQNVKRISHLSRDKCDHVMVSATSTNVATKNCTAAVTATASTSTTCALTAAGVISARRNPVATAGISAANVQLRQTVSDHFPVVSRACSGNDRRSTTETTDTESKRHGAPDNAGLMTPGTGMSATRGGGRPGETGEGYGVDTILSDADVVNESWVTASPLCVRMRTAGVESGIGEMMAEGTREAVIGVRGALGEFGSKGDREGASYSIRSLKNSQQQGSSFYASRHTSSRDHLTTNPRTSLDISASIVVEGGKFTTRPREGANLLHATSHPDHSLTSTSAAAHAQLEPQQPMEEGQNTSLASSDFSTISSLSGFSCSFEVSSLPPTTCENQPHPAPPSCPPRSQNSLSNRVSNVTCPDRDVTYEDMDRTTRRTGNKATKKSAPTTAGVKRSAAGELMTSRLGQGRFVVDSFFGADDVNSEEEDYYSVPGSCKRSRIVGEGPNTSCGRRRDSGLEEGERAVGRPSGSSFYYNAARNADVEVSSRFYSDDSKDLSSPIETKNNKKVTNQTYETIDRYFLSDEDEVEDEEENKENTTGNGEFGIFVRRGSSMARTSTTKSLLFPGLTSEAARGEWRGNGLPGTGGKDWLRSMGKEGEESIYGLDVSEIAHEGEREVVTGSRKSQAVECGRWEGLNCGSKRKRLQNDFSYRQENVVDDNNNDNQNGNKAVVRLSQNARTMRRARGCTELPRLSPNSAAESIDVIPRRQVNTPVQRCSLANEGERSCTSSSLEVSHRRSTKQQGQLNIKAYLSGGRLTIHVLEVDRLTLLSNLLRDVYVQVSLIDVIPTTGTSNKTCCRTKVVNISRSARHASFNDNFSFSLRPADLHRRLLVTVWQASEDFALDELLGSTSFGIANIIKNSQAVDGWYQLLPENVGRCMHMKLDNDIVQTPRQNRREKRSTALFNVLLQRNARAGGTGYGFAIGGGAPCRISRVHANSSAGQAGLRPDDVIIRVNGENVATASTDCVARIIRSCTRKVSLEIQRDISSSSSITTSSSRQTIASRYDVSTTRQDRHPHPFSTLSQRSTRVTALRRIVSDTDDTVCHDSSSSSDDDNDVDGSSLHCPDVIDDDSTSLVVAATERFLSERRSVRQRRSLSRSGHDRRWPMLS